MEIKENLRFLIHILLNTGIDSIPILTMDLVSLIHFVVINLNSISFILINSYEMNNTDIDNIIKVFVIHL